MDNQHKDNHQDTQTGIDQFKQRKIQELRDNQNLIGGIFGGLVASLIGAAIWAGITVATDYQISWMAVGVGFLVGFAVRFLGKGIDLIYGVIGFGFTIGGAAGPFVTGYIFDLTGSYRVAFLVCTALSAASLILTIILRPSKRLGGRI